MYFHYFIRVLTHDAQRPEGSEVAGELAAVRDALDRLFFVRPSTLGLFGVTFKRRANFWQNFGKISLVCSCIGADLCK